MSRQERLMLDLEVTGQGPSQATSDSVSFFVLTLLGAGLLALGSYWWYEHNQILDWVPANVYIESVELHEKKDTEDTCYWISCKYHYDYNGKRYTGTRVGLSDEATMSANSEPSYRFSQLKMFKDAEKPFTGYVNPKNPAEAILFREADGKMCMLPILGFVLFFIGAFSLVAKRLDGR